MKLRSVSLYQGIQVGTKLETYLQIGLSHPGLDLEFDKGLVRVTATSMSFPKLIPTANVKCMEEIPEEIKAATPQPKGAKV